MDLFSLNGRRLLSKSGWHDNRQMPTLAFSRIFGLRTACLSGVRKVSGRRGMIDRRTFVRWVRIVSFHRSLVPVRNKTFSWGWNCRFDSLSECHLKKMGTPWETKSFVLLTGSGKTYIFAFMKMEKLSPEKKSMLCEKFGDYCLDLSKLIFGGVILAAIMQLDIDTVWLFVVGTVIVALTAYARYILYRMSKR